MARSGRSESWRPHLPAGGNPSTADVLLNCVFDPNLESILSENHPLQGYPPFAAKGMHRLAVGLTSTSA